MCKFHVNLVVRKEKPLTRVSIIPQLQILLLFFLEIVEHCIMLFRLLN